MIKPPRLTRILTLNIKYSFRVFWGRGKKGKNHFKSGWCSRGK